MTVWSKGDGQGGKQYRKQEECKQQTLEIPYVNKAERSINNWESTNPQQLQLSRQQSLPPALLDQLSPSNLIESTSKNIFHNNSQTGNSNAQSRCGTHLPPYVIMLNLSRMPPTGGNKKGPETAPLLAKVCANNANQTHFCHCHPLHGYKLNDIESYSIYD